MTMRVVSLVPSLTEAIAVSGREQLVGRELLVGVTDWCSEPGDLTVARVGGTKNPDLARIVALRPDLVVANEEENRAVDLAALRAAGLSVRVTEVRTLPQAFAELAQLLTGDLGLARPDWLDAAELAWQALPERAPVRAVVPIWRRPWMVLGRDTFAGDVLRRLGVRLIHAEHPERYPAIPIGELLAARPELVVLPDEPYRFTAEDGPEAFPGIPTALLSGRHLTWYGPSLAEAPQVLAAALDRAVRR
ncbi:helical backbone metal receptor [Kitasatospora sp. P5_F3]